MKKLVSIVLAATMAASLTACTGTVDSDSTGTASQASETAGTSEKETTKASEGGSEAYGQRQERFWRLMRLMRQEV